jgi:hypothetical protein
MAGLNDPYSQINRGENVLDPRVIEQLHRRSDLDSSPTAQHHSLGPNGTQAAPGNHSHDGTNSPQLGAGITITGAKGGNAALASVIAAMVQILGVTDSTGP